MNLNFLVGLLTGWIAFTPEGKKFGNNISAQCVRYVRENLLKQNEVKEK